jgi:beta-lactamase regulating signal transducer with metallopeptidase domain
MSTLIRFYPGDRGVEFFLVVVLGVALASSAAWLISRRLVGNAALKHLVLMSSLVGILALPIMAWLFTATGLTLISIPIFGEGVVPTGSEPMQIDTDANRTQPAPSTDPRPVATAPRLPYANTTLDVHAKEAVEPAANQNAATPIQTAPDAQLPNGPIATLFSFREIATAAILAWAAGALLLLVRLAWNCRQVARLRRSSHPAQSTRLQELLHEAEARLEMRPVPLFLLSSCTVSPLAVGLGRPAIILPESLLGAIRDDELRDILVHEVTHLVRGDQRIVLLQELAGALYWPIVSVHALNRELRRASEEICDNAVLARRDAISYGETLLHIAELLVKARPMAAAVGVLRGQGELERRIAGLIDPHRNRMTTTGRKTACVVMFLFIAGCAIASATRFAASASAAAPEIAAKEAPPPNEEAKSTPPDVAASPPSPEQPKVVNDPNDPKLAGHFRGRVFGPDDKPIQHAQVYLAPNQRMLKTLGPVRAETDAEGHFEFDAPDMTYTELDGLPARREGLIVATAKGLAPDWMETWGENGARGSHWNPIQGAGVRLHLAQDDVPIQGRFLTPDGKPLADARVRLTRLQIPRGRNLDEQIKGLFSILASGDYERSLDRLHLLSGLTTETRTDADGGFTLSGLGRERVAELQVSAPGVVDTTVLVMTRVGQDVGIRHEFKGLPTDYLRGANFTLQLKRGITVKGLVRDRDTHAPIPGMWVSRHENPQYDPALAPSMMVSDENGRFVISGLDPELLNWEQEQRDVTAFPQPGGKYFMAKGFIEHDASVVIDCTRGIPFRLKLVDEQGVPVEATVEYWPVSPNSQIHELRKSFANTWWPLMSCAARRSDGTYEGIVLPGPGAVLAKAPGRSYRSAHVDPKAFFEPGRTDWTSQERISSYGTNDTLAIGSGWDDQHRFAAIVLVNPSQDSKPLELSATVAKDKPRSVTLVDPDGKPVVGVATQGMTFHPWDSETPLRSGHFLITDLDPKRARRITFVKEDRQLVGSLVARDDSDAPYSVRMQPLGTITGQLLDENGEKISHGSRFLLSLGGAALETNADPEAGEYAHVEVDSSGRFRIDRLIPGQSYSAKIYLGAGMYAGMAFENLVLEPGGTVDLGAIRAKQPVDVRGK